MMYWVAAEALKGILVLISTVPAGGGFLAMVVMDGNASKSTIVRLLAWSISTLKTRFSSANVLLPCWTTISTRSPCFRLVEVPARKIRLLSVQISWARVMRGRMAFHSLWAVI